MKSKRIVKLMASLGFISTVLALLTARNSPATGYESSIYQSTPPLVWVCFIFSIAIGIGLAVYQTSSQGNLDNIWVLGFGLIVFSSIAVLSLHIIRGYALLDAAGDTGAHLGMIRGTLTNGHASGQNYYPITHIGITQFSLVTGWDYLVLQKWAVPIFGLLGVTFIYYLFKSILTDKRQAVLASLAGVALLDFNSVYFTSNSLANLFLPIPLYFMIKSLTQEMLQWKILLLGGVFLLVPFHPVPALAFFLTALSLWVSEKTLSLSVGNSAQARSTEFRPDLTLWLLLFVWSITWISSFAIWEGTLRNLYTLITEGGQTQMTSLTNQAWLAASKGYSVALQFFKLYAVTATYIALAILALPLIRKQLAVKRELGRVAGLYGPMTVLSLAVVLLYLTNVPFGALRFLPNIKLMSAAMVGFLLFEFVNWARTQAIWVSKLVPFTVGVFLFMAFLSTMTAVYPSPYTLGINPHTTYAELDGTYWFLYRKKFSVHSAGWYFAPYSFAYFQLTPEEQTQRYDVSIYATRQLPDHFGYNQYSTLGEYYKKDVYVVIREMNRRLYLDTYPQQAEKRLKPGDFDKLGNDKSIDKLYENNGYDVWYVHSQQQ